MDAHLLFDYAPTTASSPPPPPPPNYAWFDSNAQVSVAAMTQQQQSLPPQPMPQVYATTGAAAAAAAAAPPRQYSPQEIALIMAHEAPARAPPPPVDYTRTFNELAFWEQDDMSIRQAWLAHATPLMRQFIVSTYSLQQLVRRPILDFRIDEVDLAFKYFDETRERERRRPSNATLYQRMVRALTLWYLGYRLEHVEFHFQFTLQSAVGTTAPLPTNARQRCRVGVTIVDGGVHMQSVAGAASYSDTYRFARLGLAPEECLRVFLFCQLQLGKPFDHLGYFVNYTPVLNLFVRPSILDEPRWLCSQLITTALVLADHRYADASLLATPLDPKRATPVDIETAVRALNLEICQPDMHTRHDDPTNDPLVRDPSRGRLLDI